MPITASHPLVSIVIPTYNYGGMVAEAVKSALAQTYPNTEVLVVDDGSTDNTREVIAGFGDRVRYIYQENQGLSAARNRGIREARGEYIAVLDADDIWLPGKLERQMPVFAESPDIGVVSCAFTQMDENGQIIRDVPYRDYRNRGAFIKTLLTKNIVSGGSSAVIRAECFKKAGDFDTDLRSAEDWDMWLRVARYYAIRVVPSPLVKVRVGSYSMSSTANARKMLDNECRVLDKYFTDKTNPFARSIAARRRAYAARYFAAAWAFYSVGDSRQARQYMFKSIRLWPFKLFRKRGVGLFINIFMRAPSAQSPRDRKKTEHAAQRPKDM